MTYRQHSDAFLGVPALKSSAVGLSAASPHSLAPQYCGARSLAGFPLQSLTRNALKIISKRRIRVFVYLICCTLISFSQTIPATNDIATADTLTVRFDSIEFTYVPLAQFLQQNLFEAEDKKLIEVSLRTHRVPLDSVWIEPQQWKPKLNNIELYLHFRSGILKQIELSRKGQYWEGNLSRRDETLLIDKTTDRSTFMKWQ